MMNDEFFGALRVLVVQTEIRNKKHRISNKKVEVVMNCLEPLVF